MHRWILGLSMVVGCGAEPEVDPPGLTAVYSDGLGESARDAVAMAPAWIRDDLALSFLQLGVTKQNKLAEKLLSVQDPNLVDEVAFTIAHLSHEVLKDDDFKNNLILENAEWVYKVDPELDYVEIVEYGQAGVDDDWWTVARYTADVDGQIVEYEIDRDTWYWYVVHPRIEDERPYYIDAWAPCGSPTLECASTQADGMFWRQFLWEGAAETCPDDAFCPVMKDVAPAMTHLWNGGGGGDAGGAVRDIVDYMKSSDETLGRWFNFGAYDERSIQPNRIYGLGRGNCGEWSDMTTAIARTALIPNVNVNPSSWDHTWNAFWFETRWVAWEPVNTWVDHPYGVTYSAYATRGDAAVVLHTDLYTPDLFTLDFEVRDKKGIPVDGATVAVYSPWVSNDVTYWWPAGELGTDGAGQVSFALGAGFEYTFQVAADLGIHPADENSLDQATGGVEIGETAAVEVTVDGRKMPAGASFDLGQSQGPMRLSVALSDTEGRILGTSIRYGESYTRVDTSPTLDVFVVDAANYDLFVQGETFTVVSVDEGTARVDDAGVWYAVVSNGWAHSSAAFGTLTVEVDGGDEAAFSGSRREEVRYRLLPGEHVAVQVGG